MNYASLTETSYNVTGVGCTTQVTGVVGVQWQVVGFDGSCEDQDFKVRLLFGSTDKLIMYGGDGTAVGRDREKQKQQSQSRESCPVHDHSIFA